MSQFGKSAKAHITDVIECLKIAKTIAKENVKRHQEKNKEQYDKKTKVPEFAVGHTVLLRKYKIPKELSRKLQYKSYGPYLIPKLSPSHTYKFMNC